MQTLKPICKKCGKLLDETTLYPSDLKHHSKLCKKCHQEKGKQYRKTCIPLKTGICKFCEIALTEENWNLGKRQKHLYVCKSCERLRANQAYHKNNVKDQRRITMITTKVNGKVVVIKTKKRPFSETCELCGAPLTPNLGSHKIGYHHWDKKNPHWGLWLCWYCHMFCEGIDNRGLELAKKYLQLKPQIEANWTL